MIEIMILKNPLVNMAHATWCEHFAIQNTMMDLKM